MNKENKYLLLSVILVSLAIKLALAQYAAAYVPSAKFMPDTATYLEPGINLLEKGVFATFDSGGHIIYEINRTPGYSLFLAILSKIFRLSYDNIVIIQALLITLAGYIIYKAAAELDHIASAVLAAFIFLFDLPTTISSLMLLSEAVHTFFIAVFMLYFLKYLKANRPKDLISSCLALTAATYVRPVTYYLGLCIALGIIWVFWRADKKIAVGDNFLRFSVVRKVFYTFLHHKNRGLRHAAVFVVVFYSLLGSWSVRNYIRSGAFDFTVIDDRDLRHMGLTHKYVRDGGFEKTGMRPLAYYADQAARSVAQFATIPGTLKYLRSPFLKIASKLYGYPWVAFWLIGLAFSGYGRVSFKFLLLTAVYFLCVSVLVTGLCVGSRFRVPAMPFISILSANGWMRILEKLSRRSGSPATGRGR